MSQFIVVRSDQLPPPLEGLLVQEVKEPFVTSSASRLLPTKDDTKLYEVISTESDHADSLVDDLYNRIATANNIETSPILVFLKEQAGNNRSFVCWYGSDYEDLPVVTSWSGAEAIIVECASRQPPEIYVHFDPVKR